METVSLQLTLAKIHMELTFGQRRRVVAFSIKLQIKHKMENEITGRNFWSKYECCLKTAGVW